MDISIQEVEVRPYDVSMNIPEDDEEMELEESLIEELDFTQPLSDSEWDKLFSYIQTVSEDRE